MLIKILLKYIFGYVRITIEGYYIERFINICTTSKILIWNLKREKGVRLHLNIGINDYYNAIKIAKKLKCKIKIKKKRGIPFIINRYRKRKIFVVLLIVISITIYISTGYIWNIEIQVEDNYQLENIMQDLEESGLLIGTKKEEIEIEEITNKIRLKRADISWIGIELKGTNAIVKIVKAKEAPEIIDEKEFTNIVATKDGIITNIIAQNGTLQVKSGDEVQKGQILIKGEMEGKYTGTRYVHSLGEVEAIVKYEKNGKIYLKKEENVRTGKKEEKYEIKFNKFQINFYKTLSNFEIYDTIEENKNLKIFSNIYLPISINKITNYELEKTNIEYTIEEALEIETEKLEKEIENEIDKNSKILGKQVDFEQNENSIDVTVIYEVIEKIGMQEKIDNNVQNTEEIQEPAN